MTNKEIIEKITPIFNQLLKTIDEFAPHNKGVILMYGFINNGDIAYDIGGNGKTNFDDGAKIALSCLGYVDDHFKENQQL